MPFKVWAQSQLECLSGQNGDIKTTDTIQVRALTEVRYFTTDKKDLSS